MENDYLNLLGARRDIIKPRANIINKTCRHCGQFFKQDMYLMTSSWFFPDGYVDVCNNCLAKWLGDCSDLHKADKFCQYVDIPFEPNEWMKCADVGLNPFIAYHKRYVSGGPYEELDWSNIHREWKEILAKGEERSKIDCLSAADTQALREKWGENFSKQQLLFFENMYEEIERTQSITTAIQKDNARKMCMLSYQIDRAIWDSDEEGNARTGSEVKALISAYDQLAKAADFTPKNAKNAGDFESIGELCAFLEKRGFQNKFYDWVNRDEIDKVMSNLQHYTKKTVLGETNIADELNDKLNQINALNQIDDGEATEDVEQFAMAEEEADDFNEEFNVEL